MDGSVAPSLMPELWPLVLKTGGALAVMLFIIIAMLFLAKRFTTMPGLSDEIRIIGAKHLSHKEKLILVEVLGKKILLGITPGRIEKIESFEPGTKAVDVSFRSELSQKIKEKE